jgi:site-specific recombinase XerD
MRVGDVDLEQETIKVRGKKSDAAKRTVPIEPSLRPFVEMLVAASAKDGSNAPELLTVPKGGGGKGGSSDLTRQDLERAQLTRPDLTRDDADHMPFTFHGLRHTCITHWTVAGRDHLFLLTVAGHTDVSMTRRYLAAASSLSAKFGEPHPSLPPALMGPEVPTEFRSGSGVLVVSPSGPTGKTGVGWRPRRDSNSFRTAEDVHFWPQIALSVVT